MVDLAKHASHIATQLKFLATHAAGGNRLEEADTIAALAQIAEALRSAAAVFEHEREKRQRGTAARLVGLSESTLAKLRLNGNGPVYCKLGRRVVYRTSDLEQWLQSRATRNTSDADARFLKALTKQRLWSDISKSGTLDADECCCAVCRSQDQ
jgi:predicted DNA-binding transcriptional regulator AlpA